MGQRKFMRLEFGWITHGETTVPCGQVVVHDGFHFCFLSKQSGLNLTSRLLIDGNITQERREGWDEEIIKSDLATSLPAYPEDTYFAGFEQSIEKEVTANSDSELIPKRSLRSQ